MITYSSSSYFEATIIILAYLGVTGNLDKSLPNSVISVGSELPNFPSSN